METAKPYTLAARKTLYQFDCESEKLGWVTYSTSSRDGNILQSSPTYEKPQMDYAVPGTVSDGLLRYFCKK
ncbi:Uncharacterized protein ChrSV_4279 [Chromobacterium vaccinii]|nr:Uncharacterized protein ChrSW_4279 [Chromobacterium vaccinii]QND91736.1 Uncharacterized protein ChrSV_4279 [Chromobacterium vaccinii]